MFAQLRAAVLIMLLPRLITWTADALELLGEDREFLAGLNQWQRAHVHEASACAARVWDCWEYVCGRGRRVEDVS
jgi:hypothetical protein